MAVHSHTPTLSYTAGHLSRAMGERVVRFAINLTVGGGSVRGSWWGRSR